MTSLAGVRVAIANRGEIAVRIAVTCRRLGATPILLLGEPDLEGFAARQVGLVERTGSAGSEFDVECVLEAARRVAADLLHPGYGFLSERAALSQACLDAGIRFVGPSPRTLDLCGDKLATRAAAVRVGVPVLQASDPLGEDPADWTSDAQAVGFPLLVKPAEAGGGRGLRFVADDSGLIEAVAASKRESASSGAGTSIFLERALAAPRHVEVQVVADGTYVFALGDRDCSLQRRHQKVIEEAPAPNLDSEKRSKLHEYARLVAQEVVLTGIATCEFLIGDDGTIAFLEVNPRIQVEHPVTEMVTGIDLVECQLLIALGRSLPFDVPPPPRGHAIEARIYAEDPFRSFLPATGRLTAVSWPVGPNLRIDSGYATGDVVPSQYDAMIAKVIVHTRDRTTAVRSLRQALHETIVAGLPTNVPWLINLLENESVQHGEMTTQTAGEVEACMPDRWPAVLAAVARTLDATSVGESDPWAAIGPFRLVGTAALSFNGDDWEERLAVQRRSSGWELSRDDATIDLRWWRDPADIWTVQAGPTVARMSIEQTEGGFEITGGGGRWFVGMGPKPTSDNRRAQASDGRIRAPMPGKILNLHVKVGDKVVAGQPVVTLSAMKIELVCESPVAGSVETVSCDVDQLVAGDQLLATIRLDETIAGTSER